jgi:hypothetical protein
MNQSKSKPEQLPMTSALKPILFSILILISGVVIGAGLTLILTGDSGTSQSLPPAPEYMSSRMVERIAKELRLSPEQHTQLGPIVQQHMKAIEDIRKQARPEINNELKLMNEKILSILDEDQRPVWKGKIQRMQEHFSKMGHRRDSGGGRRDGRGPGWRPRREQRRRGEFHERRPPEDQFPPEEKPPVDDRTPPPVGY